MDASWQLFAEFYPQFQKVMRRLAALDWYRNGNYSFFIGHYHAGIFTQVSRPGWFNQTLDGVHFETGLTDENLKTKRLQLDLHIGHKNLFDRETFNALTVERMAGVVEQWDGDWKFSKTNLSDRVGLTIPFTKSGFADQVAAGFTRLAELAPLIDEGLAGL